MGYCNNNIINPESILFSSRDRDINAFYNINIKILNANEIKKIKKNLEKQQKLNRELNCRSNGLCDIH